MWSSVHTTQRHTSYYFYCIHNLQSTFCKQLKNSALPTENHTCQSAPPPRLKTRHILTWDFLAITLMPYNDRLKNMAQDAFSPASCKNDCTAKLWWLPMTWVIKVKVKQSSATNDLLIITSGHRDRVLSKCADMQTHISPARGLTHSVHSGWSKALWRDVYMSLTSAHLHTPGPSPTQYSSFLG